MFYLVKLSTAIKEQALPFHKLCQQHVMTVTFGLRMVASTCSIPCRGLFNRQHTPLTCQCNVTDHHINSRATSLLFSVVVVVRRVSLPRTRFDW